MAKESPSKAEHAAPAKPQQRLLNPEAAVFKPAPTRLADPAPMRLEDLFARFAGEAGPQLTQMQAQAPPRGNTRGRAQNRRRQAPRSRRPEQVPPEDVAANPDAQGAASHSECGKLPRHTKSTSLIGLALDQSLTANTVASFVQQPTASGLLDTATSSSGKAFAQPNTGEGDSHSERPRTLFERDPAIISIVSRKDTRVGANMEGRGSYDEAKKLHEREAPNEQRIGAPANVATTVTSLPTGPSAFQQQHRHSSVSSGSQQSYARTPSGLHHSRRLSRTKRVDQGPMPSVADIYPDDAHWSPPAVVHEKGQSYMSYPAQHVQQPQFNIDNASKWLSGQPAQQPQFNVDTKFKWPSGQQQPQHNVDNMPKWLPRQLTQQPQSNVDSAFKWPQFNVDNTSKGPSEQSAQQPQLNIGNVLKQTPSVQPAKPLEGLGVSSDDTTKQPPSAQSAQQSQANVDNAPTWPRVKAYDPYKRHPLPQYEKPLEGLGPSALNPNTAPKRLPYIYDNVFARKKPPVDRKNPPVQPVQQPQVSADVAPKRPPFVPVPRVEVTVDSIFAQPKPSVQSVPQPRVSADAIKSTPPAEPTKYTEDSIAKAAKFWSSGSGLQGLINHANHPTPPAQVNKPGLSATDTSRSDAHVQTLMSQMPKPSCTWRDLAPTERSLADDKITGRKWGVQMGGIGDGRLWMAPKDQHGNEPFSLWPKEFEPKRNVPKKDEPKKRDH
jgi:hypothetical protein